MPAVNDVLTSRVIGIYNRLLKLIDLRINRLITLYNKNLYEYVLLQFLLFLLVIILTLVTFIFAPTYFSSLWVGYEPYVKFVLFCFIPILALVFLAGNVTKQLFNTFFDKKEDFDAINTVVENVFLSNEHLITQKVYERPLGWQIVGIAFFIAIIFLYVEQYVGFKLSRNAYFSFIALYIGSGFLSGLLQCRLDFVKQKTYFLHQFVQKIRKAIYGVVGELIEVSTVKDSETRKMSNKKAILLGFAILSVHILNAYFMAKLSINVSNSYYQLLPFSAGLPIMVLGEFVSSIPAYFFSFAIMLIFEASATLFFFNLFDLFDYKKTAIEGFSDEKRQYGFGIFRVLTKKLVLTSALAISLVSGFLEMLLFLISVMNRTGSISFTTIFSSIIPPVIYSVFALVSGYLYLLKKTSSIYSKMKTSEELSVENIRKINNRIVSYGRNVAELSDSIEIDVTNKNNREDELVIKLITGKLDLDKQDLNDF